MSTQQNIEERLWDYIDGITTGDDRSVIDQLIETNKEWRDKYHELLEVHQLAMSSSLEEPSMRFTKNIMEEIAKLHIAPASKNYFNKRIIWGIGIFFTILIVGCLVYGFAQIQWDGTTEISALDNVKKIDFSKIFSNTYVNIFLGLNIVLGLFFLDRFLANRRKSINQDA